MEEGFSFIGTMNTSVLFYWPASSNSLLKPRGCSFNQSAQVWFGGQSENKTQLGLSYIQQMTGPGTDQQ